MKTPTQLFPAFKEWHVIVAALAAGEQSLILRKGGIAEGRGGFDPAHAHRFWLFPTQFHAQREITKPATAARFVDTTTPATDTPLTLTAFAEVVQQRFIPDWATVVKLDAFHGWSDAAVQEKFEWHQPHGVHALVVRVYRLDTPVILERSTAFAGCKSWIEVPVDFAAYPSRLVEPLIPIAQVLAVLGF